MISRTKKVSPRAWSRTSSGANGRSPCSASCARACTGPARWEHAIPGLSKKVLNERLRKLVRFGVLESEAYPEVPPRVEYRLTPFGEKFAVLMDGVERLQRQLDAD